MEDYAEELRTPPVCLVSLVGFPELHPTISSFLHSEQPPINTLALPDFSKITIMVGKQTDGPDSGPTTPAGGILKRDWLAKHRTRIPAVVAAMFGSDHVSGDPAQWLQEIRKTKISKVDGKLKLSSRESIGYRKHEKMAGPTFQRSEAFICWKNCSLASLANWTKSQWRQL